ncbi:fungal-specific transcription factor domain-containing protein [Xylariomycetidae sp. FL0641]|nr:fungal-specific transcription factor domain-containing protein [Xylariomycetidae sp. FL0641]
MTRHKQRDEEAGGEGIGKLNTRKRMWKDLDGRIVQKKPREDVTGDPDGLLVTLVEEPISPPASNQSSDGVNEINRTGPVAIEASRIFPTYPATEEQSQYGLQGAAGQWYQSQDLQQPQSFTAQVDLNYEEAFQPDTALSFNMPYTTQMNYDWLFSLDSGFGNTAVPESTFLPTACYPTPSTATTYAYEIPPPLTSNPPPGLQPESCRTQFDGTDMCRNSENASSSGSLGTFSVGIPGMQSKGVCQLDPRQPTSANHASQAEVYCEVVFERPLGTLKSPTELPPMDGATYGRILDAIEAAKPFAPESLPLEIKESLLSDNAIQAYSDLFFTKFNIAYPLIHQATFRPHLCDPLLLLSLILLGATYAEKEAHDLAIRIHDVTRPQIFAHASFSPKPELWMLQTILLVECFGKSRANQEQADMSHLFHGMLINLIRRSDCESIRPIRPGTGSRVDAEDDTCSWERWAQSEEKKRLALLCFMWDTQHAVLFCQSLCLSAFELKLQLPCDQGLWEASDAQEWASLSRRSPHEPSFLISLKSYLSDSPGMNVRLNGLSRAILLHGLMSIFWDMQRRDQTSLGVISSPSGRWQDRLGTAYQKWKGEFDQYHEQLASATHGAVQSGAADEAAQYELEDWYFAHSAIYRSAQILLHSEFLDIQIYAGARQILGRPVQRQDFRRSEKIVRHWAADAGSRAAEATWHAGRLLRDAAPGLRRDDVGLFHVPWTLYIATLTTWAFHHAGGKGAAAAAAAEEEDGELVWDARSEMDAWLRAMTEAGTQNLRSLQGVKRTGGLVWVVANALSKVRWGILQEGVTVLRELIPRRLIRQLDEAGESN